MNNNYLLEQANQEIAGRGPFPSGFELGEAVRVIAHLQSRGCRPRAARNGNPRTCAR